VSVAVEPGHFNFGRSIVKFLLVTNVVGAVAAVPLILTGPGIALAFPIAIIAGLIFGTSRTKGAVLATLRYRADLHDAVQRYFTASQAATA
jgi:ABC-type dipeptide/oligopeptide/nickel transport system permease component